MIDRRRLRAAALIPVFMAVLAWPVSAAPPAGGANHYPGRKCIECHKGRIRPGETGRATPSPPPASPAGTRATTPPTGATPSQGSTPRR